MKKLLLAFCFSIATAAAFSQGYGNDDHPITFGLSGGSSFADMLVNSPYKTYIYATEASPFSVGLTADYKINDYFSIMPGISYAGKGGNLNAIYVVDANNQSNQVDINDIYKLHYLEIPVDFIGHWPFASGANIFLGAGPYFSYGLNGTNVQSNFDQTQTYHIKFGSRSLSKNHHPSLRRMKQSLSCTDKTDKCSCGDSSRL
ncbi:MAG: hypothetical protein JWP45_2226 [Mucilaginibacter sp.]|nr:hypothetical protein [Mucilaginibacter sp.]